MRRSEARPIRVLAVAGARPNVGKVGGPLRRELQARGGFETVLVWDYIERPYPLRTDKDR